MNKLLLNKKLWGVLIIVLVILVVFIFFKSYQNRTLTYTSSIEDNTAEEITKKITQQDSDNDGLKDWEEVLWKTDPNNPDTDEDGMNDNEEILAERDPLVSGVGDLNKVIYEQTNDSQIESNTLTQTDVLAREIFTGYMALKQKDSLGTIEQEDFIQKITDNSLNFELNTEYFTLNDLNIIQNSSKITLQNYSNELKRIFSEIPELRDDNIILKEALDSDNPELLEEIKSNIVFYEKLIEDLLETEVSIILQNEHLNLINLFKKLISNTQQIIQVFKDPIMGLIGAKEYYETIQEIEIVSAEIGEYFIQNNIEF